MEGQRQPPLHAFPPSTSMPLSSSSSLSSLQGGLSWEALRRHAKQLENEVEAKLAQYSRLGASTSSSHIVSIQGDSSSSSSSSSNSGSNANLISSGSTSTGGDIFATSDALGRDLEDLMRKVC